MKTITAKELQTNSSAIVKGLAEGQEYQITFHRRPIGRLTPINPKSANRPEPGSKQAFLRALQHTAKGDVPDDFRRLSYKQLRDRMMEEKHGKYFK